MGMSASQARFLSLTARKTNVEYEGQQINQQRTALSNESSNYYSQLTAMSVPTPPVNSDFTKIKYTFQDGSENNTITSLIAKKDGTYMLNYIQEVPVETMVVNGTSVVSRTGTDPNYEYMIGGDYLEESAVPANLTEQDVKNHRTQWNNYLQKSIPSDIVTKMTDKQVLNKLLLEAKYKSIAQEKYGENDWFVRYQYNSASQTYEPVFYSKKELENADYDEKTSMSLTGIRNYVFGEATETQEIKNATARVEQDSSGRYISIILYPGGDTSQQGVTYKLTTTTESDEAAYNDAMNQYYYDKAQYEKQIQDVNSKIEIIQVQDKNLELKLKQLDTEENAIQTEIDAVKKVISKNIDSSFKTFNA